MENRGARLFGHRIHPMLIPFPLGLLSTSVVFDVAYLITGNGKWSEIAFWMVAVGVVGGLAAMVFGAIDFARVPGGTRAHSIGVVHALLSVSMVALFAASWLLRIAAPGEPGAIPIILSLLGASLAVITGWFGGEFVERLGVGVADGAHLNAPNSLSGRPAKARARPTSTEGGEGSC